MAAAVVALKELFDHLESLDSSGFFALKIVCLLSCKQVLAMVEYECTFFKPTGGLRQKGDYRT